MSPLWSLALVFALAAGSAWLALNAFARGWRAYETRLKEDARVQLDEFFLFLDPAQLWGGLTVASLAAGMLAAGISGLWWLGLAAAVLVLLAPRFVLRRLRARRARRFDEQLPDLVQALAGALRAGSGLQPALRHIVSRSPVPLAQEFGLLLREQRMGIGFHEALAQLSARMPTEACSLVVSALGVAAQSGGGLSDTLEGIAQTLRARHHWQGRVRALTAQGRLQSWIMAGLPLAMIAVLQRLEPDAMALLWTTVPGWIVLSAISVLEILGIVLIQRVMAIDL
ncbi:type II secretion system F family protein [Castellaniella sp. GW247-6E4]|uniref:type II secretion system F family protein n=1 Tax=Castellaniella sp. GW247-6E4 TaxID=3140380 RepID=UPI0033153D7E